MLRFYPLRVGRLPLPWRFGVLRSVRKDQAAAGLLWLDSVVPAASSAPRDP